MKTAKEEITKGVDLFWAGEYEPQVFFLNTLETLMKDWPGGSYLVMKITPIFTGDRPLMAIR